MIHSASPAAGALDRDLATIGIWPIREPDRQPLCRQQIACPVRPFDQRGTLGQRLLEADVADLFGSAQPVKIEMMHGQARRLVALHQREGGARHLVRGIVCQRPDESARERRLARAQVALKEHEVARAQVQRQQ